VKRLSTGALALLIAAGMGISAVASPSNATAQGNNGNTAVIAQASDSTPAANFGSPPSGQIPILYNDNHVYSKPDTLKQGRVLAALVKGGTVLIPLRSMFEQMGAAVSYDAASKTVTVSKPGAEVKVTVGKPEVEINGESRPLDVPPIIWQGSVLVPIRVISEGMGAYVLWVPDKQLVVVRYLPPTPPPAPVATAAPVVATPPPTPTPAPKATPYKDLFIAGDYILSPKVYNEFSPGNTGKSGSYAFRGAYEFNVANIPWMIEGNFEQYQYPHNSDVTGVAPGTQCGAVVGSPAGDPGCVTVIGGQGSTYVNAFTARESDFDGRLAIKVADPRIYIGVGYIYRTNNYGYPQETGVGFGAEKLPDLDQHLSVFGSAWYYPNLKGNYTDPSGALFDLGYQTLKYQAGVTYVLGSSPVFIEAGYMGDSGRNKSNAPSNYTQSGPFVGIGLKF
jgi:hypothetical protein